MKFLSFPTFMLIKFICFSQTAIEISYLPSNAEDKVLNIQYKMSGTNSYSKYYVQMYWVTSGGEKIDPSISALVGANDFMPVWGDDELVRSITWYLASEDESTTPGMFDRAVITIDQIYLSSGFRRIQRADKKLWRLQQKRQRKRYNGNSTAKVDKKLSKYNRLKEQKYVKFYNRTYNGN